MSYENAPQTHMLATHCCICSKELCDSASVEAGMGPHCRKKYGYTAAVTEANRKAANKLIHTLATSKDTEVRVGCLNTLMALGFQGVVQAVLKSLADVALTLDEQGRYAVRTPYNPAVVEAMRSIPGRRWNKQAKINTFPQASKKELWALLQEHYHGGIGVGPKGVFVIGVAQKAPEILQKMAVAQ